MERPEIENFILDGLPAAHAEYRTAPGLFRYAQALDNYIDWILGEQMIFKKSFVDFSEWLSKNEWVKTFKTHPNSFGKYYSHKHCEYKTIEELFEEFRKNQTSKSFFFCKSFENEGFLCESPCLKCAKIREM